ncbi:MAG: hypothetical protein JW743_07255 [Deltaproteobacteria bacterium]|nr:hypothetical protein [Deltaproteobacteria bacterium]
MIEKNLLRLASLLILLVGVYVYLRPSFVAEKIKSFYIKYPIIRYAGEKQLTSRPGFVKIIGIILVIVGIACIISI